jgi:hypothetical protein
MMGSQKTGRLFHPVKTLLMWLAFLLLNMGLTTGQVLALDTQKPAPYTVVVITGELVGDNENSLGAREAIKRYGTVENGGLIRHITFAHDYLDNPVAMARLIDEQADDPKVKVIVVNQAVSGTAEGFRRVKAERPDILCLSGEPHEPPSVIAKRADLVLAGDYIARGYLIPHSANRLGARNLVHISFDRHLGYQFVQVRRKIMKQAAEDLGLGFFDVTAPDPIGSRGVEGAKDYIEQEFSNWIAQYGENTVFFPTNDLHTEYLIRQITLGSGLMVESDIPSTMIGFPGAFALDLKPYIGQWDLILKMVEESVDKAGASGRLGVWSYPLGFSQTAGLVEYGIRVTEGRAEKSNLANILECLKLYSPGVDWNASTLSDPVSNQSFLNFILVYQDTYILGLGNFQTTLVEIPLKYYALTNEK